jgi:hypothetical protein
MQSKEKHKYKEAHPFNTTLMVVAHPMIRINKATYQGKNGKIWGKES